MSLLEIQNIAKSYTDELGFRIRLFEEVNLSVLENEIVTVLAPTGSGKTAMLKAAANIERVDSGSITINCTSVFIPSLPSSFPWLSVKENIKFAAADMTESEFKGIIELIGLKGYEDHYPNNKSNGFRLRISLGRALARKAQLIFLDEPFQNIPEKYRIDLYDLVLKIKRETKTSFLLATTNVTEALYLSERIYLMSKHPGKIFDEVNVTLGEERNRGMLFKETIKNLRAVIEDKFHEKSLNIISDFYI